MIQRPSSFICLEYATRRRRRRAVSPPRPDFASSVSQFLTLSMKDEKMKAATGAARSPRLEGVDR